MKAITVLLVAAGVASAATLPVQPHARGLAVRQDVSTEVIEEDVAAEEEEVAAEEEEEVEVEVEEEAEEEVEEEEEEEVEVEEEEEEVEELDIDEDVEGVVDFANLDVDAVSSLAFNDLLTLNLAQSINFGGLGLDVNVLAAGVFGLFNGVFPGIFLDVNDLLILDAGQLLEAMIIGQALFNANAFGLLPQNVLINILASGVIGNVFGGFGAVPINVAALGVFGGFGGFGGIGGLNAGFSQNNLQQGVDVAAAAGVDVADVADVAAEVEVDDGESRFTDEEIANFTR